MDAMEFVDTLMAHFRLKKELTEDVLKQRLWMQSLLRQLRKYEVVTVGGVADHGILQRACDHLLANHNGEWFPVPKVCLEACQESVRWALKEIEAKTGNKPLAPSAKDDDYGNGFADKKILDDPLGKQAAREDWVTTLHEFIAKHRRMPVGPEIAKLKAEAQDTLRNFIEPAIRDAHKSVIQGVVGKAALTMLERRKKLADRILGAK